MPHSSNQGICNAVHPIGVAAGGSGQYGYKDDYIPHHQPFQYYASTANPHHVAPTSLTAIGTDTQHYADGQPQFDTANHQYDMTDFDSIVSGINAGDLPPSALPAVSFLKAPGYQDGHAFYSDPLDEQQFVVNEINALQKTPDWKSTAVVVLYDDSDGWYDHAYSGVTNASQSVADALTGPGQCGTGVGLGGQHGRCGYGGRQPLLVISAWAKQQKGYTLLTFNFGVPGAVLWDFVKPPANTPKIPIPDPVTIIALLYLAAAAAYHLYRDYTLAQLAVTRPLVRVPQSVGINTELEQDAAEDTMIDTLGG